MILKVGQSLASAVDTTTVIVVRAPQHEVTLTCGGVEMLVGKAGLGDGIGIGIDDTQRGESKLGKRYQDNDSTLEVLCTKSGEGVLALNGHTLGLKTAKPLPSSD